MQDLCMEVVKWPKGTIEIDIRRLKTSPGFILTLRQIFTAPTGAVSRRVAEWLNAAVSKNRLPLLGYEGSNPSSSAI